MKNLLTAIGEPVLRAFAPSLNRLNTWIQAQVGEAVGDTRLTPEVASDPWNETALQQSEEQNRALLSAIPDILTVVNAEGIYQSISYNQFSGEPIPLNNMDVTGMHISEVLPPQAAAQKLAAVQRALATRELQLYEQEIHFGDRIQYEEVRVVPYHHDGALCMVRDISDRKQTENALRQSEAKQRALIQALPDLLLWVNRDGIYLDFFTTGQFKVLGDRTTVVGTHISQTLSPELSQRRMDAIHAAIDTGALQIYEQEILIDGVLQIEECRVAVCGDDEVIIIGRDITERKRAEGQLERQTVLLARIARGEPLTHILPDLIRQIEQTLHGALGSILLADENQHLQHGASLSLPASFVKALQDIPIAESQGSCGTAAFRKQTVITSDITNDPLWETYRPTALSHGLRACWSTPIVASDGHLLGVFGVYYQEPRSPQPYELDTLAQLANIAGIALEREQAEAALRQSEAKNRAMLAAIPDLLLRLKRDGTCLDFIPPAIATEPDFLFIQNHIADVLPTDILQHELARIEQAYSTGELQVWEQQIPRFGVLCYEEVRLIHCENDEFLVIVRDITDRKLTEAALQASEERYRQIVETQTDFVMRSTPDTTITFGNPAFCRALGVSPDHVVGMTWSNAVPPDEMQSIHQKIADLSPENPTFENINSDYRAHGQLGWTQWVNLGIFDDQGNLIEIQSVGRDITAQKQAEADLRTQRNLLRAFLDNLPHMAWFKDSVGRFITVNTAFGNSCGVSPAELVNKTDYDIWPATLARSYRRDDLAVMAAKQQQRVEEPLVVADGSTRWLDTIKTPIYDTRGEILGTVGIALDITERKQAELALQESEARYRRIVETANEGIWILDAQNQTSFVNPKMAEMLGYQVDEMLGRPMFEFMDEEGRAIALHYLEQHHQGLPEQQDFKFQHKNGTDIWTILSSTPIRNDAGDYIGALGMITDISDRKQIELALRESEALQKAIIQAIPDLLIRMHRDGTYGEVIGGQYLHVLACPKPVQETSVWDVLPAEIAAQRLHYTQLALDTGVPQVYEQQLEVHGELLYEEVRLVPMLNQTVLTIIRDISDRKRAEIALTLNQERLQTLVNALPFGVWVRDAADRLVLQNSVDVARYGDLLGSSIEAFAAIESCTPHYCHIKEHYKIGDFFTYESVEPIAGEDRYFLRVMATLPDADGRKGVFGVAIDITEQKQVELALQQLNEELEQRIEQRTQALAQSEQDLRTIFNHVYDAILIHNIDGSIIDANDRALELYGATREQLLEATAPDLSAPDADLAELSSILKRVETGENIQLEWRERRFSDHSIFDAEVSFRKVTLGNRAVFIAGVRDISDRKQAERALQASEHRYATLAAAVPVAIFRLDGPLHCSYVSDYWSEMTGRPQASALGYGWINALYPDDRDTLLAQYNEGYHRLKTGQQPMISGEGRHLLPDGRIGWFYMQVVPEIDLDGCAGGYVGTLTDITARKQAEAELAQSEAKFRRLVEGSNDVIWSTNRDSLITYLSPQFKTLFGWEPDEWIHRSFLDLVHPDDHPFITIDYQENVLIGTATQHPEFRHRHRDGHYVWVRGSAAPVVDVDGTIMGAQGIVSDISDRKEAEQALRESQQFIQTVLDTVPMPMFWKDRDSIFLGCNQQLARVMELESASDLIGRTGFEFSPTQAEALQYLAHDRQVMELGIAQLGIEETFTLPNGEQRWIETHKAPLRAWTGEVVGLVGMFQDITERKQAETKLRDSEERFRVTFEQAAVGMAQTTVEGQFIRVNQTFCETLGYSALEITQHSFYDITHPDDVAENRANIGRLLAGEASNFVMEKRYIRQDGEVVWANLSVSLVRNTLGEPQYLIGVIKDISDRKKAEQQLQAERLRLQLALEAAQMGTWESNLEAGYWSERTEAIFGYAPGTFPGDRNAFLKLVHPDDQERVFGALTHSFATQAPYSVEYRINHLDGGLRWVAVSGKVVATEDGAGCRIVGVALDITERKQAEQALRDSEERLRLALTAANQGLYDLNIQTGEAIVSFEYVTMLGYDPATFRETNADWIERLHPDDRASAAHTYQAYIAGEIPDYKLEFRQRTLDGQWKWILSLGKIVAWDDAGQPLRMLGTHTDIDERKRAEAKLQEQEQFLRSIFEGVSQPIFVTDVLPDHTIRIVGWNPTTTQMTGKSSEEVTGKSIADVFNERNAQEILERHAQCIAARQPLTFEEHVILKGQSRWTVSTYNPLIDQDGRVHRIVGTVYDITDRKEAEIALQEAQQFAQSIAENTPNIIYIYDLIEQCILYTNQEVSAMLGYTSEEVQALGTNLLPAIHADDWPLLQQFQASIAEAQDNDIFELEYRVQHRRGEWRWLYDRIAVFKRDETGRVIHYIGSAQDITERKELEQELRQMNAELEHRVEERTTDLRQAMEAAEAANRAKSAFLANMSHELRTPLNAILGFAQLMSRDRTLDTEKHQQLSIINRSGEHLLHLINDILEMSKIEAGRSSFTPICLDLHTLLDTLEELFYLRAIEKGLQFTIERAAALHPYIETDENKLRQVLINLLGNAIKFTKRGSVVLRVQIFYDTASGKAAPHCAATLRFEVEDTGLGIDPAELESLFEPFTQSKNRQLVQEGTGLGLPISRQFVELMGGNLTVQSTPGVGSIFAFSIPVQLAEATALPHIRPSRNITGLAPNQTPPRILVVEDNDTNRQLLVQLLQTIGFEVRSATQGQEAIALWQRWQPQLIWMDMRMPTVDGYEATQQIRNRERQTPTLSPTIIIALTANAFEEDRARALAVGCNDFVRKPFQEAELLEKIASHLGVHYTYLEESPAEEPLVPTSFDAIAALQSLPAQWLTQCHQATIQLDSQQLMDLIEQITSAQPQLAILLREKLENFDFEPILELLQEAM